LVAGRCFDSQPDAFTAAFSRIPSAFDSAGVLHSFEYVATGWVLRSYEAGVLTSEVAAPVLALPECDVGAAVADAAFLSWGVVGAWAIAWAILAVRRALA
jgi:hypothetical protein